MEQTTLRGHFEGYLWTTQLEMDNGRWKLILSVCYYRQTVFEKYYEREISYTRQDWELFKNHQATKYGKKNVTLEIQRKVTDIFITKKEEQITIKISSIGFIKQTC